MVDQPVSFSEGFRLQLSLHALRLNDELPDTVLFLEHTPTVTLGTRGRDQALLSSREQLAASGVDLEVATRGGDATYHAPGQLVMYPILKLGQKGRDSGSYLHNLEEIAIRTCGSFGVDAFRRKGMNGAWTGKGKIAAIGFRIRRGVTLHGLSFNVNLELDGFEHIVPCGLAGEPIARLQDFFEESVSVEDARAGMAAHFSDVMSRSLDLHVVKRPDEVCR